MLIQYEFIECVFTFIFLDSISCLVSNAKTMELLSLTLKKKSVNSKKKKSLIDWYGLVFQPVDFIVK